MTARLAAQYCKIALNKVPSLPSMHPVWDLLDGQRARFVRMVDAETVELADNDGRILPDYRHISQVTAY